MTNDQLTLFCLIDGEPVSNAFEVEVASTKTVSTFKNLIVNGDQAPAFRDVAAKDLILWRVSIPDDCQGSPVTIDALDEQTELNKSEDTTLSSVSRKS